MTEVCLMGREIGSSVVQQCSSVIVLGMGQVGVDALLRELPVAEMVVGLIFLHAAFSCSH
jgi:hypothetical protein